MIRRFVRRLLDDRKPTAPAPTPAPAAPARDESTLLVSEVLGALGDRTIADVRHPRDWAMGVVPGALRAPNGEGLARGSRLVVLDQIGADAPTICERLAVPWIQGGFAAWLEEGGPIEPPPRAGRHQVGDPARLRGRDGWIRDVHTENGEVHVTVWFENGPAAERVRGETLDA